MHENNTQIVNAMMQKAIAKYERNLGNTFCYIFFGSLTVIFGSIYIATIVLQHVIRKKVIVLVLLFGETVYGFGLLMKASIILSNGPFIISAHTCYWMFFPVMLGNMVIECAFTLSTIQWYKHAFVSPSKSAIEQWRTFWLGEVTVTGLIAITISVGHYFQIPYMDVAFCNRKALRHPLEKNVPFLHYPTMMEFVIVLQTAIWIWAKGQSKFKEESTNACSITRISECVKEEMLPTVFTCSIVYLVFCGTGQMLTAAEEWKPEVFQGVYTFDWVISLHGMVIYSLLIFQDREMRKSVRRFLRFNQIADGTSFDNQ